MGGAAAAGHDHYLLVSRQKCKEENQQEEYSMNVLPTSVCSYPHIHECSPYLCKVTSIR